LTPISDLDADILLTQGCYHVVLTPISDLLRVTVMLYWRRYIT